MSRSKRTLKRQGGGALPVTDEEMRRAAHQNEIRLAEKRPKFSPPIFTTATYIDAVEDLHERRGR